MRLIYRKSSGDDYCFGPEEMDEILREKNLHAVIFLTSKYYILVRLLLINGRICVGFLTKFFKIKNRFMLKEKAQNSERIINKKYHIYAKQLTFYINYQLE